MSIVRPNDRSEVVPLPSIDSLWEKETPYRFGNLIILIEYLAGDIRTKVSASGDVISGTMPAAYGCILGTTDGHGEEIDMYLAPMAKDDSPIFVIDQVHPDGGQFDEHKVMFGFDSLDEVKEIYTSVFSDGSGEKRLGAVTQFDKDGFRAWLDAEGTALKPAFGTCPKENTTVVLGVAPKTYPIKDNQAPRDEAGGVLVALTDMSKGPKIKSFVPTPNAFEYHLYFYSGLNITEWSNTVDTFCRILDLAEAADTMHIHIASPGGSVMLMGRMVSAMARTKAKVITYAKGGVASAATAVWAAGHERHILPGSYFMQHMSSQLLGGKTTGIASKSAFCVSYIERQLKDLVTIGIFTQEEIDSMSDGADVYISGRMAISRVGKVTAPAIVPATGVIS